jgi:hypothetical protein
MEKWTQCVKQSTPLEQWETVTEFMRTGKIRGDVELGLFELLSVRVIAKPLKTRVFF